MIPPPPPPPKKKKKKKTGHFNHVANDGPVRLCIYIYIYIREREELARWLGGFGGEAGGGEGRGGEGRGGERWRMDG